MNPLTVVAHIEIDPVVRKHRFYREATAGATIISAREDEGHGVVGTLNTKRCELYGWGGNVAKHVDNTGFVYLCGLSPTNSTVHAADQVVELLPGVVVRLDDRIPHWTADIEPSVAAFVGAFEVPHDAFAVTALAQGIAQLQAGHYYGAPRAGGDFQMLLADECLASRDLVYLDAMLLVDAEAQGLFIEPCALCHAPAVVPDRHWPYMHENSRCRRHRYK